MARQWIEFDDIPFTPGRHLIHVSMNPKCEILMNGQTFEELGRPEAAVMLFDPQTDTIGVRPSSPLMPNSFAIRKHSSYGHQILRVRQFADKHDIRLDRTVRFTKAAIEDGILVLSLRHLANATRGSRKPARRR